MCVYAGGGGEGVSQKGRAGGGSLSGGLPPSLMELNSLIALTQANGGVGGGGPSQPMAGPPLVSA